MSQLGSNGQLREGRHGVEEEVPYRPRHAARPVVTDPRAGNGAAPERPRRSGRHAVRRQPYGPTPIDRIYGWQGAILDPRVAEDTLRERQLAGLNALFYLANATAVTEVLPALRPAPSTLSSVENSGPRLLVLLKDPALRGALALIFSAVMAGGLGYVFWALTAHYQKASAVGSVSAEVSAITFLASVGVST